MISADARAQFEAAMRRAEIDSQGGDAALAAFLRDWPRTSLADDAGLRRAELLRTEGDSAAAAKQLEWVIRLHPRGDRTGAARLLLARIESERGNLGTAYRLASGTPTGGLTPEERNVRHRLLASLAGELDDYAAELRWLAELHADTEDEHEIAMLDVEIDSIVARLDGAQLERAASKLGSRPIAGRVRLQAADAALGRGDLEGARRQVAAAARLPLSEIERERLTALRDKLEGGGERPLEEVDLPDYADLRDARPPSTAAAQGTLGVVLPLSGPFASYGEQCLRGVLMAAEVFSGSSETGPNVRLEIRDSAGNADQAAQAVIGLEADSEVSAIVGPLLGGESESAAGVADRRGIPLVSLTAREEVARGRPGVFRMGRSTRAEVQVLADYAVRNGHARFAILYPDDAYGQGLKDLFWDAVERRGGHVVGVSRYDPKSTDFADGIRSMIGFALLGDEEKEALKERRIMLSRAKKLPPEGAALLREEAKLLVGPEGDPLPPIVDFDALFIADSHSKAALIAPQLAFHEIVDVRLLGANGWNHPDFLKIGRKHVDGAVFAEAFYPQSKAPVVADFTRRYTALYDAPPDALAAQAFDATNLLLVQLARGHRDRDDLRDGLRTTRAYPGASGVTTMMSDGNAQKRPFLLGVQGRRIVPVEEFLPTEVR